MSWRGRLRAQQNADAAERLARTPAGAWTRAPRGEVLNAYHRAYRVNAARVTLPPTLDPKPQLFWDSPPDPLAALRDLANRIVESD